MLDYIWCDCKAPKANASSISKHLSLLSRWRRTINKMHIYNSTGLSLVEKLNYSRAIKDIDSLMFRLSKISGIVPTRVSDDSESEEHSTEE